MKEQYEISLHGCDVSNRFNMMLGVEGVSLIEKMCELSPENSHRGCMPTMDITKLASSEKSLKVYYDGELNVELDNAIESAVGVFGFKRWASGYDLIKNQRDLAFEMK